MTTISNNILFELTANKGAVAERYEYNGFGAVSMYNASYNPIEYSAISNTYLFAGREYEAESGLYYYRARHYSPTFGRFLQRDPIGIWEDETNLGNGYSYVGNNGVNGTDAMGLVKGGPEYYGSSEMRCQSALALCAADCLKKAANQTGWCWILGPETGATCAAIAYFVCFYNCICDYCKGTDVTAVCASKSSGSINDNSKCNSSRETYNLIITSEEYAKFPKP